MKLIILGNGYDLASKLPTKYSHFFKYRMRVIRKEIRLLEQFLENFIPFNNEVLISEYYTNSVDKKKQNFDRYMERPLHKINLEARTTVENKLENIFLNIEALNNNFSFWDFYFWLAEIKNTKTANIYWNDIEYNLLYFFMNYNNYIEKLNSKSDLNYKPAIELSDLLNKKSILTITDDNLEKMNDNLLYGLDKYQKQLLIIQHFFNNKKIELTKENIHWHLLKELYIFENSFRDFIGNIMDKINVKNSKSQRIYRDNLFSLINVKEKDEYYILNFNYTSIASAESMTQKGSISRKKITITREGITYPIMENNVHGKYDKISIFGIDQTHIEASDPHYIFSKTYRKLSDQNKLDSLSLPKYKSNFEIIFYGHSLSNADYSYFQSIFDFYDIYAKPVKLIFCYSLYDSNNTDDEIRHSYFQSVTKLIKEYGASMSNQKHGNNLIHKLLLENRLHIKEVFPSSALNDKQRQALFDVPTKEKISS